MIGVANLLGGLITRTNILFLIEFTSQLFPIHFWKQKGVADAVYLWSNRLKNPVVGTDLIC